MIKLKNFIRTSLFGGLAVILPVAILLFIFGWIYRFCYDLILPLTTHISSRSEIKEWAAFFMVMISMVVICFVVGVVIKTSIGKWVHGILENRLLKALPFYPTIVEVVKQFLGAGKSPFSRVALVQIYSSETMMTAFVTDEHENGLCTVFVPTGPNPTSGNIYHLNKKYVHIVDAPIDETMRSIIACGAGSGSIISRYTKAID